MLPFVRFLAVYLRGLVLSRHRLSLENVALRQPLTVLKRQQPRPRLHRMDRLFWVTLRQLWSEWSSTLFLVQPETVVSWHRAGFRLFWRWRSQGRQPGRPPISGEVRQLIRRLKAENPSWGAPRLHGELRQLGFDIAEPTVSRYLRTIKRPGDAQKAKRWRAFLHNHREVIAAMDFFTVPILSFRVLYGFFVIEHGRRRIPYFQVTAHPTSDWVVQQLREAFPFPVRIAMWFSIAIPNSARRCYSSCEAVASSRSERAYRVRGRTESPSVGWAVFDASCSIMSSR
jgi:putative transposase